jgi:hypothetical protein
VLALFAFAIFLSASLLFVVQPMTGKLVLPLLGGSPAVWNTSLVFFQLALLAGYFYAHALRRLRDPRLELAVHLVLATAAVATLPVAVTPTASAARSPIAWLLAHLATSVGPSFFVLSATGPLLQRWFASTRHPGARDPYFLYAASNTGSLLALLGYPVLELLAGLKAQGRAWTLGYLVFVVTCAACGLTRLRRPAEPAPEHGAAPAPAPRDRLRWLLLAFVPSAQMMGVTLFLTTDVASAPLLWVLPLALYLLSFVLAFARRQLLTPETLGRVLTGLVVVLAATLLFHSTRPIVLILILHLLALLFGAWLCHARLAAQRPDSSRLTEFYLHLSAGGALGGLFAALVAPYLFDTVLEYPIALGLALLMRPGARVFDRRKAAEDLAVAVIVVVLFALMVAGVRAEAAWFAARGYPAFITLLEIAVTAMPLIVLAASFRHPRRLALVFAAVVLIEQTRLASRERLLHLERTFFGVHRVVSDNEGRWRRLSHGTTRHGLQYDDPRLSFRPMMYYHPTGPIGDVFRNLLDRTRVGIVGLGAGTIAAYATGGRQFTFFEIDPEVERIADRFFTYIKDARARGALVDVVLGDARLTLARQADGSFDLLVLDAFSSDAIPLHLLTREAVALYLTKLKPDALLAFHVSNGALDLRPALGAAARDLGLRAYACRDTPPPEGWPPSWIGKDSSTWVVLARRDEDLRGIPRAAGDHRWIAYAPDASLPAWTDDRSSLLTAIPLSR